MKQFHLNLIDRVNNKKLISFQSLVHYINGCIIRITSSHFTLRQFHISNDTNRINFIACLNSSNESFSLCLLLLISSFLFLNWCYNIFNASYFFNCNQRPSFFQIDKLYQYAPGENVNQSIPHRGSLYESVSIKKKEKRKIKNKINKRIKKIVKHINEVTKRKHLIYRMIQLIVIELTQWSEILIRPFQTNL